MHVAFVCTLCESRIGVHPGPLQMNKSPPLDKLIKVPSCCCARIARDRGGRGWDFLPTSLCRSSGPEVAHWASLPSSDVVPLSPSDTFSSGQMFNATLLDFLRKTTHGRDSDFFDPACNTDSDAPRGNQMVIRVEHFDVFEKEKSAYKQKKVLIMTRTIERQKHLPSAAQNKGNSFRVGAGLMCFCTTEVTQTSFKSFESTLPNLVVKCGSSDESHRLVGMQIWSWPKTFWKKL